MAKSSWAISLIRSVTGVGILCASSTALASSELDVIATIGPVTPTSEYFSNISWVEVQERLLNQSNLIEDYQEILADDVFFPLTTDLKPGRLASKEFVEPKPIHQPFVVVGDDNLSREWLRFRHEHLVNVGAVVYVVSAESFDKVVEIRAQIAPLVVAPGNGNAIGRLLMLERYPFMVDRNGVWQ